MNIQFFKKLFPGFVLLLVMACEQTGTKLKIGVIAPLTGEGATYGASMKRGINLALKNNNDVEVIFEDSKLNSKDGLAAIKKLITFDKVDAIYGAAASGVTTTLISEADKNKIVIFSSISTSDALTNASPYFFRNVPRNQLQGETAANYLIGLGNISKIAIFNENDEYGVNLTSSFKSTIIAGNVNVVYESSYLSTETDFRAQLTKIKNTGAQAVFMPGNYEETGIILRQAKELGLNAIFVGGDGSYSPTLIEYAEDAAEGFICTIMGVEKNTKKYAEFLLLFEAEFNQSPDVYDIYAYEAGLILQEALSGDSSVREYLSENTFDTFSGELSFSGSDMIRSYGIVEIKGGRFVSRQAGE